MKKIVLLVAGSMAVSLVGQQAGVKLNGPVAKKETAADINARPVAPSHEMRVKPSHSTRPSVPLKDTLINAIKNNQHDVLRQLVRDIKINQLYDGKTLVDYAREFGNKEAESILKSYGGRPSADVTK